MDINTPSYLMNIEVQEKIRNAAQDIPEEEQKFLDDLNNKYADATDYEGTDVVSEEADVVVDTTSGRTVITEPGTASSDVKKLDTAAAASAMEADITGESTNSVFNDPTLTEESVSAELKDIYGMSEEDILRVLNILSRLQKGEQFSVYNAMPEQLQTLVRSALFSNNIPPTQENRNLAARSLMKDIVGDIKNDASFVEFQEALTEIGKIPSLMDFHAENCQELMEVKLLESADKLQETKPDVAESLRSISKAWVDTYNFTSMTEYLEAKERVRNRLTKNLADYDKIVDNFNLSSQRSKYIINDVGSMVRVISNILKDFDTDIIKEFVLLFIETVSEKYPGYVIDNPTHVAFVYYTIKNIISLEFVNFENACDFNKTLLGNITKLLTRIQEIDAANRERMTSRPMSKKERRRARKNNH